MSTLERKLGFWESYKKLSHDHFLGAESLVLQVYIQKSLDKNTLIEAIKFVFKKHPLLQAVIEDKEEFFYFRLVARFDDIPIAFHQGNEALATQITNQKLNYSFDDSKFLWCFDAVIDSQSSYLIVALHHAISDGMSLMSFVLDILHHYYLLAEGKAVPNDTLPMLPPVEQLLPSNVSFSDYLLARKNLAENKFSVANYQNIVPYDQRSTLVTSNLNLSLVQTQQLKVLARKHQLTLNSLLAGIWIKASLANQPESNNNLAFKTPINLRPQCKGKVGLQDIGNYVAIVWQNMNQLSKQDDVIKLALTYQTGLKENMWQATELPKEFTVPKLRETFHVDEFKKMQTFPLDLVMTNPGKVIMPSVLNDYFGIQAFTGGVNLRFADPAILLGVFEYQQKIVLCFNHVDPLVTKPLAHGFIDNMQGIIYNLCKNDI